MDENSVLHDLPRGVGREAGFDDTPNARWQTQEEILQDERLWFDPEEPGAKLFLGEVDGELIGIEDDRHMMTVAGSRAGKGVSAIVGPDCSDQRTLNVG